jgi:hypothetical protein
MLPGTIPTPSLPPAASRTTSLSGAALRLRNNPDHAKESLHGGFMRKLPVILLLVTMMTVPALADKKQQGTAVLKDSQPVGTPDKHHKHQAYDLSFNAVDKAYTCRTDPDKSMNATDFVVGSSINYEIDGKKIKIKTPENKQVQCKVVRVEVIQPMQ